MEASTVEILKALTEKDGQRWLRVTAEQLDSHEETRQFTRRLVEMTTQVIRLFVRPFEERRTTEIVEKEVAGGYKPSPVRRIEAAEALAGRPTSLLGVVDEEVPSPQTEKVVNRLILPVICDVGPLTLMDVTKIWRLSETIHALAEKIPDNHMVLSPEKEDDPTVRIGTVEKVLYLAQQTISGQYRLHVIPFEGGEEGARNALQGVERHLQEVKEYDFSTPPNTSEIGMKLTIDKLRGYLSSNPGSFIRIPAFVCLSDPNQYGLGRQILLPGGAWRHELVWVGLEETKAGKFQHQGHGKFLFTKLGSAT